MYLNCEATNPASEFIPPPIRGTSSDKKLKLHPQFFAATYEEWFEKSLLQWAEHLEFGLVFGGFIDDRLMGIVKLEIDHSDRSAYLSNLYVRQNARGKSFAKAMVKYLLDYATTHVHRVHLRVVDTNNIAQHFFKSLGFKIYGVISHQYLDGRSRLMLAISLPVTQPKPVFYHNTNGNLAII
ncbi:MAG: GNAT family N-acetyltransferase [Xenococcaceae cyanobacterium MO_207.B15]|nr:GNAT family N-acetyltransferase [Xenococcaceae cyanobacterium MO_207.B15]